MVMVTLMPILLFFLSDKGPSLRQLSRKGPELEMPLLHLNGDGENSAADECNDEDEEQELFSH